MSFFKTINAWVENVDKSLDEVVKHIVIELGADLIELTPVDTGRLKGNWIMSINGETYHSNIRYDDTGDVTFRELLDKVKSLSAGDIAYIANRLLYSEIIEWGGSPRKAPEGMLRVTAARFEHYVDEAVAKHRV